MENRHVGQTVNCTALARLIQYPSQCAVLSDLTAKDLQSQKVNRYRYFKVKATDYYMTLREIYL